jgi:periplasmic divalent cation tolerance protein
MTKFIEIQWTSGSLDEARKISRYLVQERLAASAQIIPWIESIYMWNNQLETAQETKIILKSQRENFSKIKEVIEENCKYEVPEILMFAIEGGNDLYLKWLEESSPD